MYPRPADSNISPFDPVGRSERYDSISWSKGVDSPRGLWLHIVDVDVDDAVGPQSIRGGGSAGMAQGHPPQSLSMTSGSGGSSKTRGEGGLGGCSIERRVESIVGRYEWVDSKSRSDFKGGKGESRW